MATLVPDPQLSFNRARFQTAQAGDTFFDTTGSFMATRFLQEDERGLATRQSEAQNFYVQAARCNSLPPEARARCLAFYGFPASANRLPIPVPVTDQPSLLPWTKRAPANGVFVAGYQPPQL